MTENTPRRAQTSGSSRSTAVVVGVVVVVLAVVVALVVNYFVGRTTPAPEPSPSPSVTTTQPVDPTQDPTPDPTPTDVEAADPALAGCEPLGDGFVPTRYQMENPEADEEVLSLGLDADGAIAAPPPQLPRTASWWNGGPRPGSDKGKVVLSIHTYRSGGALGNEMYDGEPTLEPGDLISLTDDTGRKTCYEFSHAEKIWVDEYDPDSDILVDWDGDPMLVIVICWDFVSATEDWDSRIFFYATPVSETV